MIAPVHTLATHALVGAWAAVAPPADSATEQVRNPNFRTLDAQGWPAPWSVWTPEWTPAAATLRRTPDGLLAEAPGQPFAVGGVAQDVPGIRAGQAYRITADGELRNLPAPFRRVLVRLHWTRDGQPLHPAGLLVRGPSVDGTALHFADVVVAPAEANGARLALELKWPEGGAVLWQRVSLTPTNPPPARRVKVGTVYLRPHGRTPAQNLDLWCAQVEEAGRRGLDIVCLGEAITMVGTGKTFADCAEPVPGPATRRLGEVARQHRLWVVAGLLETSGQALCNTAVLLDRDGRLAGTYRKIHLPREEWQKGVTPGAEYPVFHTDFGTVAIQICYDWFFPEAAALFAARGAEILFAPTWGNTLPDENGRVDGENTFRVRARDNGLYLVPSVYDGNSLVIDPMGRILVSSGGREGVFSTEIDLNTRESLPWVGHWRDIGPRDRMPATYAPLTAEP